MVSCCRRSDQDQWRCINLTTWRQSHLTISSYLVAHVHLNLSSLHHTGRCRGEGGDAGLRCDEDNLIVAVAFRCFTSLVHSERKVSCKVTARHQKETYSDDGNYNETEHDRDKVVWLKIWPESWYDDGIGATCCWRAISIDLKLAVQYPSGSSEST